MQSKEIEVWPPAEGVIGEMAGSFWLSGVRAYFSGDRACAVANFEACLAEPLDATEHGLFARRALFCAQLLDESRIEDAIGLLRHAVRADPDLREAHIELCLALSARRDVSALRTAAATAIVEGGLWSDIWQRPAAFLPGLTSRPFWDPGHFPWISELEENFGAIRDELNGLSPPNDSGEIWAAVGGEHRSAGHQDGEMLLNGRGSWREIVLFALPGEVDRPAAPLTARVVKQLVPEAVSMAEAGAGEVVLSALSPGTHVAPHCATTNHRLTAHLGIRVPRRKVGCDLSLEQGNEGNEEQQPLPCGIRVGEERREWQEGRVMVFDDSYEHEVWNDSSDTRIVLLIRFWHPDLFSADLRMQTLAQVHSELARAQRLRLLPPLGPDFMEPGEALEQQLRADGGGKCIACGREGVGGDLMLDEERKRAVMTLHCCGHVLE